MNAVIIALKDLLLFLSIFFSHTFKNLIWLVCGKPKKFDKDIVLITGSAGYLGKMQDYWFFREAK